MSDRKKSRPPKQMSEEERHERGLRDSAVIRGISLEEMRQASKNIDNSNNYGVEKEGRGPWKCK